MNKKIILFTMLTALFFLGTVQLSAQVFTGSSGSNIPGNNAGFYCTNAATSVVQIDMPGRIGESYRIDNVVVGVIHEFPAEMQLSLVSPRGNIINLSIGNGGSLDNAYSRTVFRDGGLNISNSVVPFNSNNGYRPQGNSFEDQFDNEKIAGAWTLEICDLADNANGGVINEFSISFTQIETPVPDPVYGIQVSSTNDVNVNLNADCQIMLAPGMLLNGNFDADGDGNTPPIEAYNITVMDDNPCNGPIVDGCGEFEFWVNAADTMPQPESGFDGCSMMNIVEFNSVPLPSSGQSADVEISSDTITLMTLGGDQFSSPVIAGFTYTFDRSGTAAFRLNFENVPFGPFDLDIVRIRFDGTVTQIPSNSFLPVNGLYTIAQPLNIEPGDILQIELRNQDGASQPGDEPSVAKVFDFFFIPTVAESTVLGSLPLGGFVNAVDATPAEIVSAPVQNGTLFTSQLSDVMLNGLSPAIQRKYIVDGRSGAIIDNSLHPEVLNRLNIAGGLPVVYDGCSNVEVMIFDQIVSAIDCEDIVVRRTFAARDIHECESLEAANEQDIITQDIVFTRPSFADVIPPTPLVEISCDGFSGANNPQPIFNDFPLLQTADGPVYLNQAIGNIAVTFSDGPQIMTCDNTFKFVRTYSVIDWCDVEDVTTFTQLVKVGDFEGPMIVAPTQDLDFDGEPDQGPLVFSTNALNCTAFFDITSGVSLSDDCSDPESLSLIGFIYPDGDLNSIPLGPYSANEFAMNIPQGEHTIQYISSDGCGNADTLYQQIQILDLNAPVAICEDGLNLSLNGNGTAILQAEVLNEASYDDCGEMDLFYEIAILDSDGEPITPWMESLSLNCTNIGTLLVGLRVTDDANMNGIFEPGIDNSNSCETIVMVEDENNPICIAPTSLVIACADLENDFPNDLEAAFDADADETIALLNARFGSPNGIDNCPGLSITQTVQDNRTDCGTGTILRSFGVMDAQGFSALPNCNQSIQIAGSHNYTIVFPQDENSVECLQPSFDDVNIIGGSCDMITVGMNVDTFAATADDCRLVRISYEVLNLCEYSTTAPAYIIPRDADGDGIPGEQVVVHVTPGQNSASTADDVAVLDRDINPNNGNSIINLDTGNGGLIPGNNAAGYGQDASRGFFLYTQFITISDDTPPVINLSSTDTLAQDTDGNCMADLDIEFSITDGCSMNDISFTAEVDLFVSDFNGDGTITLAEFVPSYVLGNNNIDQQSASDYLAMLNDLPIGRHAIRISANDGCGNNAVSMLLFTAEDAMAAAPLCINGLTATLSADENGDGIAQVAASTFVVDADVVNDCSGPVNYAVYRIAEAIQPGFQPNISDNILTVTCEDLGPLPIRIYAIDAMGMTDFCETTLNVQVNDDAICDPDNNNGNDFNGVIAGGITTPSFINQEGVEINITAQATGQFITYTNQDGNYVFQNLMEGDDYTIEPIANPAINLANVTTGDLILISRHILALEHFNDPHQFVAADVNNDHSINILDLIAIRRVILGLTMDYPASNSWTFVSGAHDFGANPDEYLGSNLMTVYNINNLEGTMLSANFMAIEMGNVSDASNGSNLVDDAQGRSLSTLEIPAMDIKAGEYYEISIPQPTHLLGFQTSLELNEDLELIGLEYGTATASDFNLTYQENGLLGIAHVNQPLEDETTPLFILQILAKESGQLENMLSLSDRIVISEAYVDQSGTTAVTDLDLDFKVAELVETTEVQNDLIVKQNYPNPFRHQTTIQYNLPSAGPVELRIHDQQGRTILLRKLNATAGNNQLQLNRTDLGEVSGLLHYTITSEMGTVTRQMLLIQ